MPQNAAMTEDLPRRSAGSLPKVSGLLRRQRREAERALFGLVDTIVGDSISLERIVRRININAIIARLDIAEIISRLDIDALMARIDINAIIARVDIEAIVARVDLDAIIARLDMNEVIARMDLESLADRITDGAESANRLDRIDGTGGGA